MEARRLDGWGHHATVRSPLQSTFEGRRTARKDYFVRRRRGHALRGRECARLTRSCRRFLTGRSHDGGRANGSWVAIRHADRAACRPKAIQPSTRLSADSSCSAACCDRVPANEPRSLPSRPASTSECTHRRDGRLARGASSPVFCRATLRRAREWNCSRARRPAPCRSFGKSYEGGGHVVKLNYLDCVDSRTGSASA